MLYRSSFNPYCYWSYLLTYTEEEVVEYGERWLGFNPYCYWSYLLTYDISMYTVDNFISNFGFNPYCYWSYLLTEK